MLVTRKRNLVRNGWGPIQVKGNLGSEGQKGKTKYQVVDEDVTSKSSFEVLEATLPNSTCEHGTFQAQGEGVATVEHDMLTI